MKLIVWLRHPPHKKKEALSPSLVREFSLQSSNFLIKTLFFRRFRVWFVGVRVSLFCLPVSVLPSGSCLRQLISSSDDCTALPPESDSFHSAGFCLRETMSFWNRSCRHRSIYDSVLRCPTASHSEPPMIILPNWFGFASSSLSVSSKMSDPFMQDSRRCMIDCRRRCSFSEL